MQLLVSPGFFCMFISFNVFPYYSFLNFHLCKTLNLAEFTQVLLKCLYQFYYVIGKR